MSFTQNDPMIKVTFLGKGYGIRLFKPDGVTIHDESFVKTRLEVGPACRELLRWYDKMGSPSRYADKARHRRGFKEAMRRTDISDEIRQKSIEIYTRGDLK